MLAEKEHISGATNAQSASLCECVDDYHCDSRFNFQLDPLQDHRAASLVDNGRHLGEEAKRSVDEIRTGSTGMWRSGKKRSR